MIISFFGHSDFEETAEVRERLSNLIKARTDVKKLDCYCGGYGRFDGFVARVLTDLKKTYPNINRCLILPYQFPDYLKNLDYVKEYYDEYIYPPLEKVPYKLAIIKRNEWMVDQSEETIFYVDHTWGGAARIFEYTIAKHKCYSNLSSLKHRQ